MSTPANEPRSVLSTEIVRFFESESLLSASQDKKRNLSMSLLSFSSWISCSGSTATSITFETFSKYEKPEEIVIPDILESKETYAFMRFTDEVAADLWQRFLRRSSEFEDEFLDFATLHVEFNSAPDCTSGSDDWNQYLRALGINDRLREATLMPEYEDIRYSASCKHWVLEAIEANYKSLFHLDDRLQRAKEYIQRLRETGRKHTGSVSETTSAPDQGNEAGQSSSSSTSSHIVLARDAAEGENEKESANEVKDHVSITEKTMQSSAE